MARTSAADRRDQLVEAAIRVMSQEGLERATTRRIAEEAGTTQGVFHYAFRDKNELLTGVIGAVTLEVEKVLRRAVDPSRGLAAAIRDALQGFWAYVTRDDGLQLMQYELTIFSRRTPGFEWLAEWQYSRYTAVALEVFTEAAAFEPHTPKIDLRELSEVIVAAIDGLVIQYEVAHDESRSLRNLDHVIRACTMLAGLEPAPRSDDGDRSVRA